MFYSLWILENVPRLALSQFCHVRQHFLNPGHLKTPHLYQCFRINVKNYQQFQSIFHYCENLTFFMCSFKVTGGKFTLEASTILWVFKM